MDDVWFNIKTDLYRYAGNTRWTSFAAHLLRNRAFKYSFWFRQCRSPHVLVRKVAEIMHRHLSNKYMLQIPADTQIGYGLYLGHHMCVAINRTAKIGNNCNLSQFTTIGSNGGRAAEIGDNVYIGPNVCLVEYVKVGHGATIGAGSVVVKDVPENATVAGSPARVISMKRPERYIHQKWV